MLNRPAATLSSIETLVDMQKDPVLAGCIERVQAGFNHAHLPTLTSDGTSGTYILQDRKGDPVAVFKPMDEEPFAPNNPRGMCGLLGSETTRPGVRSGEQAAREAIAYLLDHESFADVPATSLVRLSHPAFEFKGGKNSNPTDKFKFVQVASFLETSSDSTCDSEIKHTLLNLSTSAGKVGSLQEFVSSVGPVENYSSDLFTVDEVHKIAVLDLRLLNLDRNPCNILVQQTDDCTNGSNLRLIPIDHGLTLPDCFQVSSYDLVWMSFSQAEAPLSQRTMDYIQAINVDDDIKFIESRFAVRPICLRNMKISTLLLQQATQRGLSLFEIGRILCRPDDDDCQPSILEQLVAKSEQEMATEDLTTLNFKKFAK